MVWTGLDVFAGFGVGMVFADAITDASEKLRDWQIRHRQRTSESTAGYDEDAKEPSRPYRPEIDDHRVQVEEGNPKSTPTIREILDKQKAEGIHRRPWRIRRKQLEAAHRTKRKHAEDLEKP